MYIDDPPIGGSIKIKASGYEGNKAAVVNMKRGPKARTEVVTSRHRDPMEARVRINVMLGANISTHDLSLHRRLEVFAYDHTTVR